MRPDDTARVQAVQQPNGTFVVCGVDVQRGGVEAEIVQRWRDRANAATDLAASLNAEIPRLERLAQLLHDWYCPKEERFGHAEELDDLCDMTPGELDNWWYREACKALGIQPVDCPPEQHEEQRDWRAVALRQAALMYKQAVLIAKLQGELETRRG